jgi:hypothetical protein
MEIPSKFFRFELQEILETAKKNIEYNRKIKNSKYIYATTKKYKYHTEMWLPNTPINLDILADPEVAKLRAKDRGKSLNRELNILNSVRRTRASIFGYAAMNPFTHFVTFTQNCSKCIWKCAQSPCSVDGPHKKVDCNTTRCDCPPMFCDRFNLEMFDKRVSTWLKNTKTRHSPDLEFLLVFEKHKTGAFHAHAFIKGYTVKMTQATDHFTLNSTFHDKRPVYNMPGWKFGYSTAKIIGQTKDDNIKTAGYLTKYITKDTITDLNKHRYKVSRGLNKPFKGRNPDNVPFDDLNAIDSAYECEYGYKLQYDNRALLP